MIKPLISLVVALTILSFAGLATADSAEFKFESIQALDDMATLVRERFPLGSPRSNLRRTFVTQGQATLKTSPLEAGVEKYIYDINLCSYYVWRWNVSADYDPDGKLRQAYVNGNAVFPEGTPKRLISKVAEEGKKASIFRLQRPRPEAFKGETSLGFILFDRDSDLKTAGDQTAIGAGPSRADPMDMGTMVVYTDVDPWRSIFDSDSAEKIAAYQGDCLAVDRRAQAAKPQPAR